MVELDIYSNFDTCKTGSVSIEIATEERKV